MVNIVNSKKNTADDAWFSHPPLPGFKNKEVYCVAPIVNPNATKVPTRGGKKKYKHALQGGPRAQLSMEGNNLYLEGGWNFTPVTSSYPIYLRLFISGVFYIASFLIGTVGGPHCKNPEDVGFGVWSCYLFWGIFHWMSLGGVSIVPESGWDHSSLGELLLTNFFAHRDDRGSRQSDLARNLYWGPMVTRN